MARLSLGFSLFAVCVSIGSFVAVQLQSNPAPWEPSAINQFGRVLVFLSVALALARERQPRVGASQAHVAAVVVALGFAVVGLVKLYSASIPVLAWTQALQWAGEAGTVGLAALSFGLVGSRIQAPAVKVGFGAAALVALGSASYALSLETNLKAEFWYFVALTAAALAASAGARLQRGRPS